MKSTILIAAILGTTFVTGCKPPAPEAEKPAEPSTTAVTSPSGSGNVVAPLSTLPVGTAPVAGGENIGGTTGGGIGNAAKDQAKRKAGKTSLDQMDTDE